MINIKLQAIMQSMIELKLEYQRTGNTNNLNTWMQLSRSFREEIAAYREKEFGRKDYED